MQAYIDALRELAVSVGQAVDGGRVAARNEADTVGVLRIGIRREVVIEGSILLEDDHNVLDALVPMEVVIAVAIIVVCSGQRGGYEAAGCKRCSCEAHERASREAGTS